MHYRKHLVIGQFKLSSSFRSFSLGTINRQTPYDSGNLRQDYGIIRGFPICTHYLDTIGKLRMTLVVTVKTTESYEVCRFGHTIWLYIYWNGPKRGCLIVASDQTVRAVQSCNSWLRPKLLRGVVIKIIM